MNSTYYGCCTRLYSTHSTRRVLARVRLYSRVLVSRESTSLGSLLKTYRGRFASSLQPIP